MHDVGETTAVHSAHAIPPDTGIGKPSNTTSTTITTTTRISAFFTASRTVAVSCGDDRSRLDDRRRRAGVT